MATVEIETPSTARPTPSSNNKTGKIKGLGKQRLRAAGKRFETKEEKKTFISALISAGPKTPGDLLEKLGGSDETIRLYCKELEAEGKIEKEGQYWKKKAAEIKEEIRQRKITKITEDDFNKIPILAPFVQHATRQDLGNGEGDDGDLKHFRNICTGKVVKSFKCHPEDWVFPDTITQFRDAYFAERKTNRISSHTRQTLRYFVELCLNHKLSETENAMLGIDGGKDNAGAYADCMFKDDNEFETLMKFLERQGDNLTANVMQYLDTLRAQTTDKSKRRTLIVKLARLKKAHPTTGFEAAAYVAFGTETFFRPATRFKAIPSNFRTEIETIIRAKSEWDTEWTYDEARVRDLRMFKATNPALESKITVDTFKIEVIQGKGFESKTGVEYPKEIRNPMAVDLVKRWIATRTDKKTMFGYPDETPDKFEARMIPVLEYAYRSLGLTHQYFYMKSLYALRHCGAHLWLRRTGYNYNAVASMGWEDINTLRQFYGKYDHRERKKSYVKAW